MLKLLLKFKKKSFSNYIWNFVDGKPIQNQYNNQLEIPQYTNLSSIISKDLKERGFKFTGPTAIYSFMQATGLVNDHLTSCFRYNEIKNLLKR